MQHKSNRWVWGGLGIVMILLSASVASADPVVGRQSHDKAKPVKPLVIQVQPPCRWHYSMDCRPGHSYHYEARDPYRVGPRYWRGTGVRTYGFRRY